MRFKVAITIDGDLLHFDFTGTDQQRPSPMNATLTQTFAACAFVTRCLIDRDIPVNDGFFRMIKVTAPEGSAVNARAPVGVAGGWEVSLRLCDLLFQAFSKCLPGAGAGRLQGDGLPRRFRRRGPTQRRKLCFYRNSGRWAWRPVQVRWA